MNTRTLVNIVLLLVALALVAVVVFAPGGKQDKIIKLTTLDKAAATRIMITRNNQEDLVFEKQNGKWFISKPIHTAANPVRIDALLDILHTTSHARFPATGKDLAPFGLKTPLATLTINNTRIEFGGTESVNRRRYVMLGDKIHLITDSFYHQLKIELPSFVANQLFDSPIESITISNMMIHKNNQGEWQITPHNETATADILQAFVDRWQTLQAEFIERSNKSPASGTVKVTLDNGKDILFDVIKNDKHTFLRCNDLGLQYQLFAQQTDALFDISKK